MTNRKTSDLIAPRTAGALPSSRTESMLADALASDNIDEVKAQLVHVWGHYQALEFELTDRTANEQTVRNALADDSIDQDTDPVTLTVGFFATGAIERAYAMAHLAGDGLAMGLTMPESLRMIYSELDHSDPKREAAAAGIPQSLEDFLNEVLGGDASTD